MLCIMLPRCSQNLSFHRCVLFMRTSKLLLPWGVLLHSYCVCENERFIKKNWLPVAKMPPIQSQYPTELSSRSSDREHVLSNVTPHAQLSGLNPGLDPQAGFGSVFIVLLTSWFRY